MTERKINVSIQKKVAVPRLIALVILLLLGTQLSCAAFSHNMLGRLQESNAVLVAGGKGEKRIIES